MGFSFEQDPGIVDGGAPARVLGSSLGFDDNLGSCDLI